MHRIAVLLVCLLVIALPAAGAQSGQGLQGRWVWEAEGRPLLLLTLEAGEDGQLAGTLQRPTRMELSPSRLGIGVSGIQGAVHSAALRQVRSGANGTVLGYTAPDGSARESLVRMEGADALRFVFFAAEPDGFAAVLSRASEAAEIPARWDASRTYFVREPPASPNAELAELFAADQADRATGPQGVDWASVAPRDAARRARVRQLLDAGMLRAADDYYRAAFIYQHGDRPDDFLLAHVLAMSAMALGRADAAWIASATLDRHLWSLERPQVLGTQFGGGQGQPLTQGEYDAGLVPDSVRQLLGVPTREQQEAQREQINRSLQSR